MSGSTGFKKASKKQAKLRLALAGPPGSGKTYSALAVASALVGNADKIALIDTEFHSSEKYADEFGFQVLCLDGSFHPRRYIEGIKKAEEAGFEALIIDSLSHAWIGKDGGLDLHNQAVARQKTRNSFTAWAEVTPEHQALVTALVQCKCHLIVTLRTKVEHVQEKDEHGRSVVRKVGMAPLMRDGVEYEFDVVGDMDDATLCITKTRCKALKGQVIREPGKQLGDMLAAWLSDGAPYVPPGVVLGLDLLQRIQDKDDALAAAKLCQPGMLLEAVRLAGIAKGLSSKIEDWPEAGFHLAVAQVKVFEAKLKTQRQESRPREPGCDDQ